MKNRIPALAAALLLSACATSAPPPAPAALPIAGLERVMGKDARALFQLFGEPDLDIREGTARKFQFAGPLCVLDTYLYPPSPGAAPVTTYAEARTPQGDDFDRASCIAALSRRQQAR